MFLGEYKHSVDGKGRLVMPSRYRAELSDQEVVITIGRESQLVVYPAERYLAEMARYKENEVTRKGRRVARALFSAADQQKLDSAGRLLLSPGLRDHAGLALGGDVTLVGMIDKIEIWNPERWVVEKAMDMEALQQEEEEVAED